MVNIIVNNQSLSKFLKSVLRTFDEGDLFEFADGKLSCVFDDVSVEHKGSGYFAYSKQQLIILNTFCESVSERPLSLEFTEVKIKVII